MSGKSSIQDPPCLYFIKHKDMGSAKRYIDNELRRVLGRKCADLKMMSYTLTQVHI